MGTRIRLEGHPGYDEGLYIDIPPASFTNDVFCITGLGMPLKGSATLSGDLYVRIKMVMKQTERVLLGSAATQDLLKEGFGGLRRVVSVNGAILDESDVQKELFLTKLPE
jgi:DnaJ-class molecular chaperone